MKERLPKSLLVILSCIWFFLSFRIASAGQEIYRLKPLFDMEVGKENTEWNMVFVGPPWRVAHDKPELQAGGPFPMVDNSGNFYLMNELKNILKLNSRGEIIKQINGKDGFTKPWLMFLDRWDNLYVKLRNETNVAEQMRFLVAKFDSQGNFLCWLSDRGTSQSFRGVYLRVSINGTVRLNVIGPNISEQQRFDSLCNFTGLVEFPADIHEGADGSIYKVGHPVKKYVDVEGSLKTLKNREPSAERKISIEKDGREKLPGRFHGFDIDNYMYFCSSNRKVEDLEKCYLVHTDILKETRMLKYNFSEDRYDTLVCQPLPEKSTTYVSSRVLKNYVGEIYEIRTFFSEAGKVTPEDYVRFYKWEKVKE